MPRRIRRIPTTRATTGSTGFKERFGPRGVLHCYATKKDDKTEQPRWGRVGKQTIEDTGPLTRKRMETCDDDFVAAASDFIKRQHESNKPFFCWVNMTHMHLRTHTKKRSLGQAGRWQSPYHDTMIDHDKNVGQLLDLLDKLEIADDTIVMYGTDNGPHMNTWPDGAMTPFRSEKNTNWEGAFRVPLMVRWPGKIPAGVVSNEIVQHHDWLPTFLAAAGEPDIVDKLKVGHEAAGKTFQVHIDGYNLLPYLTGEVDESPRKGFIYFSDDGDLVALRFDNWKIVFMEQRRQGTLELWAEPFTVFRVPKLFNLRTDPFERADVTSNTYWDWYMNKAYMILAAQALVAEFLATFKDFPPRQKAASFTIDQALEKMADADQRSTAADRSVGHGRRCRAAPSGWARTTTTRRRPRRTPSMVERVLDRPLPGHQPPVRRVRRGDRLRDGRRAAARSGRLPGRSTGEPRARLDGVHDDRRSCRPAPPRPVVEVDARRLVALSGRSRQFTRWPRRPPRRARRLRGR